MKAIEARKIFEKKNRGLSIKEKIKIQANKGFAGMSVPRLNDNDPQIKKLERKGYLISHSDNNTYITWAW